VPAVVVLAIAFGFKVSAMAQGGAPLVASEVRTLTASDGVASAYFGSAVSVSGSFAAVGAYGDSSGRGAVYIFERNQGGADEWQMVRKITVSDGANSDHFGFSVSLSGSMLAVGAPDNNQYGTDAGLVYIFERNLGGADQWGLLCKVASSHLSGADHFGYSVSLDLNLLAVGAYGDKPGGVSTGAAYVFHMNRGSAWFGQVAELLASDGAAGDQFGGAVAISGDQVVVGAHMDDNEHGTDAGAAYLFTRDQGGYNNWGQVRKFTGESDADHYGRAVAIHGTTILLGAPDSTEGGSFGRAYVYERNKGGADAWGWVKTLIGGTALGCKFGGAVALSYERAMVGASMEAVGGVKAGSVIVFGRDFGGSGNWGRLSELVASDCAANDYFGAAVALDGNVAVIGAHGDDPSGSSSGSARLFRWTGNRWYFEEKLTNYHPAFPRAGDYFGSSVAFENGWLAVGAPRQAGYNGWGTKKGVGAATVTLFQRRPPGQVIPWGGGQNIIYNDVGSLDCFGAAVALSHDKLVVGAPLDPCNDGNPRGMAYFFHRNQGGADAWGQVGKSNQHTRHDYESVGRYVAIEGDTIVLGSAGIFSTDDPDLWWGNPDSWYELIDFWDDDIETRGGNTYLYGRDAGGQSQVWDYLRRHAFWAMDQVVAISGNTFAVGIARDANDYAVVRNEVQIYGRNYGGEEEWGWIRTIKAPAGIREGGFGGSVALDGDTLAVGPYVKSAQVNPSTLPEGDSVFICERNAGGADAWGLVREIKLSSAFGATGFGAAIALSGDVLLVGAVGQSGKAGAVYVFERNVSGADRWGLVHQFTAPESWPDLWFGQSVALGDNVAAVGAPGNDMIPISSTASLAEPNAGAVYVFSHGNNRAPVMRNTPGTSAFSVSEDTAPDWIFALKVSTLVQRADVADADGDVCGIAVIEVNNTGGQWQYSTDGSLWQDLRLNTEDTARVIGPDGQIRFVPAANFNGLVNPGITFRAWDQTVWGSGGLAYASMWGGYSCFSEETEVLQCEVLPVNDRPVLSTPANVTLPDVYGNILSQYYRGLTVSNLLVGVVTDPDTNVCGMAVTSAVNANGEWEYSLDNGVTWRAFGSPTTGGARLLGPDDRVRFMPNRGYSGTVVNGLGFVAWDQTAGTHGNVSSTTTGTAFSTQSGSCSITVTPIVNHAPVLNIFGEPVFPTITKDATMIEGTLISTLLTNWVEDLDGDLCGIALAQTDSTYGTWDYSLDDGANWLAVGTVSFEEALLLGPDARLRFRPVSGYSGTIQVAVLYRAWDQTDGVEGTKVNAEVSGGSTSLSITIELAPITVLSTVNHAPVLASPGQVFLTSIRQDVTNSPGDRIADLIQTAVTDADGDACGIAIYGLTINYGTWEYSMTKGLTWVTLSGVSTTAARLLGPNTLLRFIPAVGFTGTVTNGLDFRAWDRSAGTNGGTGDLKYYGNSTPYSSRAGKVGITVGPLNHAPRLLAKEPLEMSPITENQFNNSGDSVSNLLRGATVTDAEGDACGMAITYLNDTSGGWQFSLDDRRSWTNMSTTRMGYTRLLPPSAIVRFVPDAGYSGFITNAFEFLAWDQSSGAPGANVLLWQTGGETAFSTSSGTAEILVRAANVAPVNLTLSPSSILENQPAGTLVGLLTAEDANADDSHTFYLVSGAGDEDNNWFNVVSNRLVTAREFDREARAEFNIRLRVRDAAGSSFDKPLVVTILDLNDASPTGIQLSPASVAENLPAGTVVGQLIATDPDLVGTSHTFALCAGDGDSDNALFAIQGSTVVTTGPLDYEAQVFRQIRVQADDGTNPPFAQSLNIAVEDVAENVPPQNLTLNCTCLLPGSPPETVVGLIRIMDPNPGDSHTLSLVTGEGDTDNDKFLIRARTLVTATTLNFDLQAKYHVRIQVTDAAGESLQVAFEVVAAVPIWQEDFENGVGQWTHAAEEGQDTWQFSTDAAHSPSHSLCATGTTNLSDASVISPWIEIPPEAGQMRLEFHHQYDWAALPSDPLDGGVLECRRQGEPWQDAMLGELGNSLISGAYRASVSPTNDHPLSARRVWSGNSSNSFVSVAMALNAGQLAGQSVQFRWRQVTASALISPRWYFDDVVLGVVISTTNITSFSLVSCALRGDQLDLSWQSVPTQTYTIESSPVPGGGLWSSVGTAIPGGLGASVTKVTLDITQLPGYPHQELYFRIKSH
jgi:hypothetical protein